MQQQKNIHDKAINSEIKWYKVIILATVQGGKCTSGCLLDYDHIKNYYKITAVDLSRQKELDADAEAI